MGGNDDDNNNGDHPTLTFADCNSAKTSWICVSIESNTDNSTTRS
jgi:hypothetical protein